MDAEDRACGPLPEHPWPAAGTAPRRVHRRADLPSVPGVQVAWLFASPAAAVTRWSCCKEDPAKTAENHQPWHVVTFIHGGSFQHYCASGRAVADSNVLLFYNPRQPFSTSHPFGCGDRGSSLVLHPELVRDLLAPIAPAAADRDEPLFPGALGVSSPEIHLGQFRLVERLARALDGEEAIDAMAVEERILALAAAAVGTLRPAVRRTGGATKDSTGRFHRDRVEAARELMQRRFREPLALAEIARAVHLSPCHLSRVFRRETGVPVHRYLTGLRLRAALEAVSGGARDLSALALETGFASHSHFTAAFRKEFGAPPSALRGGPASGAPGLPLPALRPIFGDQRRGARAGSPPFHPAGRYQVQDQ